MTDGTTKLTERQAELAQQLCDLMRESNTRVQEALENQNKRMHDMLDLVMRRVVIDGEK